MNAAGMSPQVSKPGAFRKKLAVTKTRNPATIAMINANAKHSPLLKLPTEIRTKIFSYVLGNQLIHLKQDGVHKPENAADASCGNVNTKSQSRCVFRHVVCSAATTEDMAYTISIQGCPKVPEGEDPNYYVQSCDSRHSQCYPRFEASDCTASRLSLSLLCASRQTYEEANHIFWTTNTFSFTELVSFRRFVEARNFAQKKMLAKLHFNTDQKTRWQRQWTKGFSERFATNLRELKRVYLCLEVDCPAAYWLPSIDPELLESTLTRSCFLRFQHFPLTDIRVILAEQALSPSWSSHHKRYTWLEKREIACYYEARLSSKSENADVTMDVARKLRAEQQAREASSCMMLDEKAEEVDIVGKTAPGVVEEDTDDMIVQ
ncbi:MAG: hypothetical protein LQ338_002927 [Usnochroma carphineum]|nr:MAG: hypothetical protein LQ338_002927 [Usnochroma carphineum]